MCDRRRIGFLPLLILLFLSSATGAPDLLPASVVIHPGTYFAGFEIEPQGTSATFDLDLGDQLEFTLVEVVPHRDDGRSVRVQYQVETSLTIMDEGPHIDLVDWKHHTSNWTDLERVDSHSFRMPKIESDAEGAARFPAYDDDELYEAALAAGGQRWADIVRRWPAREDGRVGVGISTVRVRVLAADAADAADAAATGEAGGSGNAGDGNVETLFTLHIRVPMGC